MQSVQSLECVGDQGIPVSERVVSHTFWAGATTKSFSIGLLPHRESRHLFAFLCLIGTARLATRHPILPWWHTAWSLMNGLIFETEEYQVGL